METPAAAPPIMVKTGPILSELVSSVAPLGCTVNDFDGAEGPGIGGAAGRVPRCHSAARKAGMAPARATIRSARYRASSSTPGNWPEPQVFSHPSPMK